MKNKIMMFGWILILYFIYSVFNPILWFALSKIDRLSVHSGPIGGYDILKAYGINNFLIAILTLSSFILFILPLVSLIAGIGVLRLKEWSRKFLVIAYTTSTFASIVILVVSLTNKYIKSYSMAGQFNVLSFLCFLVFQIITVSYFIHPKIKEQFTRCS